MVAKKGAELQFVISRWCTFDNCGRVQLHSVAAWTCKMLQWRCPASVPGMLVISLAKISCRLARRTLSQFRAIKVIADSNLIEGETHCEICSRPVKIAQCARPHRAIAVFVRASSPHVLWRGTLLRRGPTRDHRAVRRYQHGR